MGLSINTALPLVLGTAQLGSKYGIANRTGKPQGKAQAALLELALESGIRIIDTAPVYGDSEAILGTFLRSHAPSNLALISKLDPKVNASDPARVVQAVAASVARLGQGLHGLLLHDTAILQTWNASIDDSLNACRSKGLVAEFGVSTYTPEEFEVALGIDEFQLIQAPFNLFDQRLLRSGLLAKAKDKGKTVFLRSAFLQGLLLMQPTDLPAHMGFAADRIEFWRRICREHALDPADTALRFVRQAAPGCGVVIGCETSVQLKSNVGAFHRGPLGEDVMDALATMSSDDQRLIDPRTWDVDRTRSTTATNAT
jgi:aryl-alcohol dehydrogenase-like predicted oxidoreductase